MLDVVVVITHQQKNKKSDTEAADKPLKQKGETAMCNKKVGIKKYYDLINVPNPAIAPINRL